LSHEFRGDKESFQKGKSVIKGPLKRKLRADFIKILGELKESQNGGFEGYGEKHSWTHKSCIWELPYAKTLKQLDSMRQHGVKGGQSFLKWFHLHIIFCFTSFLFLIVVHLSHASNCRSSITPLYVVYAGCQCV
jgi:hypothetical protein